MCDVKKFLDEHVDEFSNNIFLKKRNISLDQLGESLLKIASMRRVSVIELILEDLLGLRDSHEEFFNEMGLSFI